MAKSSVFCAQCGITFLRDNKNINLTNRNEHKHYCSKTCQYAGRLNGNLFSCMLCGKSFYRPKSKSDTQNLFCSHTCANSYNNGLKVNDKHPMWKSGKASYRHKALSAYENVCHVCGYDVVTVLQVHHIDKNRNNNKLHNLVLLCPTHHKECGMGLRIIKQ
jgi:hypothetical protein